MATSGRPRLTNRIKELGHRRLLVVREKPGAAGQVAVDADLVATRRLEGLGGISLKVLTDGQGGVEVACDPVGVPPGEWVIATRGTSARYAAGSISVLTDLTICGIIDNWQKHQHQPLVSKNKGDSPNG